MIEAITRKTHPRCGRYLCRFRDDGQKILYRDAASEVDLAGSPTESTSFPVPLTQQPRVGSLQWVLDLLVISLVCGSCIHNIALSYPNLLNGLCGLIER